MLSRLNKKRCQKKKKKMKNLLKKKKKKKSNFIILYILIVIDVCRFIFNRDLDAYSQHNTIIFSIGSCHFSIIASYLSSPPSLIAENMVTSFERVAMFILYLAFYSANVSAAVAIRLCVFQLYLILKEQLYSV